jgi:hypothetical protein
MKVAFGLKAHSGWAVLVALGEHDGALQVVDRRRLELVDPHEAGWAKQPYHAAEGLTSPEARQMVQRGLDAARKNATGAIREATKRVERDGHRVTACAVLTGRPMPEWSVDDILAVHVRMHTAEGVLFRDALVQGATACGLRLVPIQEKELNGHAARALAVSPNVLQRRLAMLGKPVGPPWGKDQKDAALAAMVACVTAV